MMSPTSCPIFFGSMSMAPTMRKPLRPAICLRHSRADRSKTDVQHANHEAIIEGTCPTLHEYAG